MARLRKGVAYRNIERPYTRKSKVTQKSFIKGAPPVKISRFIMGDHKAKFPVIVKLISRDDVQIRQEALEADCAKALLTGTLKDHTLGSQK
ncbi:hypothetical protein J7L02_01935 [Candidatus Woesearchaeota archaeon]|nr:hypothetical protein [Candidatus Woesearchaeota archaeon]